MNIKCAKYKLNNEIQNKQYYKNVTLSPTRQQTPGC